MQHVSNNCLYVIAQILILNSIFWGIESLFDVESYSQQKHTSQEKSWHLFASFPRSPEQGGKGEEKFAGAWGVLVVFRWNHAFATRSVLIFQHMLAFRWRFKDMFMDNTVGFFFSCLLYFYGFSLLVIYCFYWRCCVL